MNKEQEQESAIVGATPHLELGDGEHVSRRAAIEKSLKRKLDLRYVDVALWKLHNIWRKLSSRSTIF